MLLLVNVTLSGISVGGIMPNRKAFSGNMLPFVDHIVHTHSLPHMAYSKGQPAWGDHLADDLERVIARHDASTIAAVVCYLTSYNGQAVGTTVISMHML